MATTHLTIPTGDELNDVSASLGVALDRYQKLARDLRELADSPTEDADREAFGGLMLLVCTLRADISELSDYAEAIQKAAETLIIRTEAGDVARHGVGLEASDAS